MRARAQHRTGGRRIMDGRCFGVLDLWWRVLIEGLNVPKLLTLNLSNRCRLGR